MKLIYTMLIVCLATYAQAQTVVEIIVNSADHNTLEEAVIAAELDDDLSGDGPFTVFAPTDAAFAALPPGTIDNLLLDPTGDLAKILLYHVLGAEVLSTDLSDGQTATTLLGQGISVTITSDGVFINDAKVTVADLDATNGVVHVLDAVLSPPASTVVDVVANSDVHTTLEAAVMAAELATTLSGDGPFTLFAPTDAAFAALPPGTVDDLLLDPTGDLADILLHHVLAGEVLSSSLSDGQVATTLFNQDVTVTINSDGVFINDAEVIIADIRTFNGVVHVIDAVLIPIISSVADLNQVNIDIMPNPATDFINVELPTEMSNQEVTVQLINLNGSLMKSWTINDTRASFQVSEYPTGTYILLLNTETDYARTKVIVAR